jgi:hypothetical protein
MTEPDPIRDRADDITNDDTEGHIHARGTDDAGDTDDDTEGHIHARGTDDAGDTDDDTEGHIHAR